MTKRFADSGHVHRPTLRANTDLTTSLPGVGWGQFGRCAAKKRASWVNSSKLCVDARCACGATTNVSHEWARWLNNLVQVSAGFVKPLVDLGEQLRLFHDVSLF